MNKTTALIALISLLIGGSIGYSLGNQSTPTSKSVPHNHETHEASHTHTGHTHDHERTEASTPYPSVDLIVHKDPKSGWNAQIIVENFTFAPERASTQDIPGEGHAHIYVDGEKINRVYSEWYHLGKLESGMREVSVLISSNEHKELTRNGEPISDMETVHVPAK